MGHGELCVGGGARNRRCRCGYRGGAEGWGTYTNAKHGLLGTLTVASSGKSIQTMQLEYPIPDCVTGGFQNLTRLPVTDVNVAKNGTFRISATVRSGAQSDPNAPAKTTVSGRFIEGGRKVDVAIKLIISYPSDHKGCTTQTLKSQGTFTLRAG